MSRETKIRAKYIEMLVKILENESVEIAKIKRYRTACWVATMLLVFCAMFFSRIGAIDTFWVVIIASLGGIAAGIGVYFDSALKQWPVIKEFLDKDALYNARENDT